jgi:hypothetical protein
MSFTPITKCSILVGSLDSMLLATLDSIHPGVLDYMLPAVIDSQRRLALTNDLSKL